MPKRKKQPSSSQKSKKNQAKRKASSAIGAKKKKKSETTKTSTSSSSKRRNSTASASSATASKQQQQQPASVTIVVKSKLFHRESVSVAVTSNKTNTIRRQFFSGLDIQHTSSGGATLIHSIHPGDLCAVIVDDDSCGCQGLKGMDPWPRVAWRVGQVVALCCELPSPASGGRKKNVTKVYRAVVRLLVHYKKEQTKIGLPEKERKELNGLVRADQMLLETKTANIVMVDVATHLLPAKIVMRDFRDFIKRDPIPPEPIGPEDEEDYGLPTVYELLFHCPRYWDGQSMQRIAQEWVDYPSTSAPAQKKLLLRAWHCWKEQTTEPSTAVVGLKLSEVLAKKLGQDGYVYSAQPRWSWRQPENVAGHNNKNNDATTKNAAAAVASEAKPQAKKRPGILRNDKNSDNRTAPSAKRQRRVGFLAAVRSRTITQDVAEADDDDESTTTTATSSTSSSSSSTATSSLSLSAHATVESTGPLHPQDDPSTMARLSDLNIQPTSHTILERSSSQKGVTVKYVEGVEMNYFPEIPSSKKRKKGASGSNAANTVRWKVQVGDLIAVRAPSGTVHRGRNNKNQWYPFNEPWNPAQVIAVFYQNGRYYMELRWFYRIDDLNPETLENLSDEMLSDLRDGPHADRMIVEVDEHVDKRCPVDRALGRVVTTSETQPSAAWLAKTTTTPDSDDDSDIDGGRDQGGVPQVSMICKYNYLTEFDDTTLCTIDDWTDYGKWTLRGPLSRGILCPKGRAGRHDDPDKKLVKAYQDFLRRKYSLPKEELLVPEKRESVTAQLVQREMTRAWSEGEFTGPSAKVMVLDEPIHSATVVDNDGCDRLHRDYFHSVQVPVISRRCDPRATANKKLVNKIQWTLRVGDIVCLADDDASRRTLQNHQKAAFSSRQEHGRNPWFPFVGPWSFCQVLSIYRDVGEEPASASSREAPILLEVRRFYRKSDLPDEIQCWMPPYNDSEQEEVYETCRVETGISAVKVLGRVELFLSRHNDVSNPKKDDDDDDDDNTPTAVCRCRYFYDTSFERFQPLFCSDKAPIRWLECILERGFRSSQFIKAESILVAHIESRFNVCLEVNTDDSMETEPVDMAEGRKPVLVRTTGIGQEREYFVSATVRPPWSSFAHPDTICSENDREACCWTVRVGDVVIMRDGDRDIGTLDRSKYYPFKEPWKACQILAIYRDRSDGSRSIGQQQYLLEVRSFSHRRDERIGGLDVLDETKNLCAERCDTSMLLGPTLIFFGFQPRSVSSLWNSVFPFLPVSPFGFGGAASSGDTYKELRRVIRRGLSLSSHYHGNDSELVWEALKVELERAQGPESSNGHPIGEFLAENAYHLLSPASEDNKNIGSPDSESSEDEEAVARSWVSVAPVHIDRNSRIEYFSELSLHPPYDAYLIGVPPERKESPPVWTVKLGDMVILQHKTCDGRARYGGPAGYENRTKTWPLQEAWAVGEVVTIFKHVDAKSSVGGSQTEVDGEELELEIRWFYRRGEIKGSVKGQIDAPCSGDDCEEIFESDHYDTVEPASLLCPALLHPGARSIRQARKLLDMPVIEFWCRHFYSVSGAPRATGGLEGRIERARNGSKYSGRDSALKQSLDRLGPHGLTVATKPSSLIPATDWQSSFQRVIKKLSLNEASKDAYENRSELVGREKEIELIISFLRDAIRGKSRDCKTSIFIAGPPGVGKTASVRAAIHEIRYGQSNALVPAFDFVSLNGMEMRHPSEVYVKLWEELTGERCRSDKASGYLEAYFTDATDQIEKRERVTVILLDEIDYLVTHKQNVLYNIFDWPTRAIACKSKRRAVVVGISNTLNLPERLRPAVQSRIGPRRCFFKSYNVQETTAILKTKLKQASPEYDVFEEDALIFASKKTAALSGDIRKAFRMCRAAAELIYSETASKDPSSDRPKVRIKDVLKVSRESFNSAQSKGISLCTSFEALLLIALSSLTKSTGREVGGFDVETLLIKMEAIANASGNDEYLPPPGLSETLGLLTRLGELHLISLTTPRNSSVTCQGCGGPWPMVSMEVDELTMLVALKNTQHNDLAQKHLTNHAH